jgi:cytochrome c-type biogenesis protein
MFEISGIGIISAFLAGLVSFLSPCVLPLVPGYVSFIAGESLDDLTQAGFSRRRLAALLLSAFFVLGFSAVFIALGASASTLGEFLRAYQREFNYAAGGIVVLFGLYLSGLLRIPLLQREFRFAGRRGSHPAGAFVLGAAFAFGWTPCIGPVLGAILTISASQGSVGSGAVLLAIYSIGLGVPFLVAAAFTGVFLRRIRTIGRVGRVMQVFAGAVLVVMGIAMITGYLSKFAFWLLEMMPALATIG